MPGVHLLHMIDDARVPPVAVVVSALPSNGQRTVIPDGGGGECRGIPLSVPITGGGAFDHGEGSRGCRGAVTAVWTALSGEALWETRAPFMPTVRAAPMELPLAFSGKRFRSQGSVEIIGPFGRQSSRQGAHVP